MIESSPRSTANAQTRAAWMGVLARATSEDIAAAWAAVGEEPPFEWLREPEVGLVMVRARAGGTGDAFNLGEMTVTRCALSLAGGAIGISYVQGRDKRHAKLAALFDALLQDPVGSDHLLSTVIEPLRARQEERRLVRSRKAASTKVDFFTVARGSDLA